jgi:hypothetical protein
LYKKYNKHLVIEQLARSSKFTSKSPINIEIETEQVAEFKNIFDSFGKGTGALV